MAWLSAHIGTIVAALFLVGIVVAIISGILHDRKKGKSSCGCGCSHCAMADTCHKPK